MISVAKILHCIGPDSSDFGLTSTDYSQAAGYRQQTIWSPIPNLSSLNTSKMPFIRFLDLFWPALQMPEFCN